MNVVLPAQDTSPLQSTNSASQIEALRLDESMLGSDTVSALMRALALKWRINQSINQNEVQRILTGVKVVDLHRQDTLITHNEHTEHFAASINKPPVALLVQEDLHSGKLRMDQVLTWQESDRRDGGGVYDVPNLPSHSAKLSDVLYDMLNRSGNTAVRILVNYALGQATAVNERWSHIPQLSHTYLMPLSDPTRFYLGNSTPHDALWTLGELVSSRDQYGQFIYDALATSPYTDYGTRNQLAGNDYIVLINKLGLLNDPEGDNRHDVGIIYNTRTHKSYGYATVTTSPQSNPDALPQAEQSLKDIGRAILRYAGDTVHYSNESTLTPRVTTPSVDIKIEKKLLY